MSKMMENCKTENRKKIQGIAVKIYQTDKPLYDKFKEFCKMNGSNPTEEIKKYITSVLSYQIMLPDLEKTDYNRDKFVAEISTRLREESLIDTQAILNLKKTIQEMANENTQLQYALMDRDRLLMDKDRLIAYLYSILTPDQLEQARRHEEERLSALGYLQQP